MPGSPPTSTAEPGTTPPPSTRSNSSIPVGRRGVSLSSICSSVNGSAPCVRSAVCPAATRDSARASGVGALYCSRLSQVPQSGHLPIHLGWTLPQWLHKNCVRDLAMCRSIIETNSANGIRSPRDDIELMGIVQQGLRWRKFDAGHGRHRVFPNLSGGRLERPGHVANVTTVYTPVRLDGIKTISCRQKMLERSRAGLK